MWPQSSTVQLLKGGDAGRQFRRNPGGSKAKGPEATTPTAAFASHGLMKQLPELLGTEFLVQRLWICMTVLACSLS